MYYSKFAILRKARRHGILAMDKKDNKISEKSIVEGGARRSEKTTGGHRALASIWPTSRPLANLYGAVAQWIERRITP